MTLFAAADVLRGRSPLVKSVRGWVLTARFSWHLFIPVYDGSAGDPVRAVVNDAQLLCEEYY